MEKVKVPVFIAAEMAQDGSPHLTAWSLRMDTSPYIHIWETEIEIPAEAIPDMRLKAVEMLRKQIRDKQAACAVEVHNLERRIASLLCIEMEAPNGSDAG